MDVPLVAAMTVTPAWMSLWARLQPNPQRKLKDYECLLRTTIQQVSQCVLILRN